MRPKFQSCLARVLFDLGSHQNKQISIDIALKGSLECNVAPVNDMKANGGKMSYIHSFLTSTLDAYKWPTWRSGRFTVAVTDRKDLTASADVSDNTTRNRTAGSSITQHSHYTNWATYDSVTAVWTSSQIVKLSVTLTIKSHKIFSYVLKLDSHVLIQNTAAARTQLQATSALQTTASLTSPTDSQCKGTSFVPRTTVALVPTSKHAIVRTKHAKKKLCFL
jgi:hypothetical protein